MKRLKIHVPRNGTGHRNGSEIKVGRRAAPALTFLAKEATWVAYPVWRLEIPSSIVDGFPGKCARPQRRIGESGRTQIWRNLIVCRKVGA